MHMTIKAKLTFFNGIVLTASLLAFGLLLYIFLSSTLNTDIDTRLRNDLEHFDDLLPVLFDTKSPDFERSSSIDPENWLLEVWSQDGRIYTNTAADSFPLGKTGFDCAFTPRPSEQLTTSGLRVRAFCQRSASFNGSYVLRGARLDEKNRQILKEYGKMVLLAGPIVLILSMILGYFLAKSSLAPVERLARAAAKISVKSLNSRLPVQNPDDELGRMADIFNQMFSRLESSFQQMRRFSSDASHELRTPLTVIRALGENALAAGKKDSYPETIASMLEETSRLSHLCESLLLLSRADSGQQAITLEKTDLHEIGSRCVQLLGVLAEEKLQTIELSGTTGVARCRVDQNWVRQAVMDLIDNAIKYTPESGKICIETGQSTIGNEHFVFLAVRDNGPGITQEHQEKIFERFYRIDPARGRKSGEGAGLGLAIARWAVEASGGSLIYSAAKNQGSVFTIQFKIDTTKGEPLHV